MNDSTAMQPDSNPQKCVVLFSKGAVDACPQLLAQLVGLKKIIRSVDYSQHKNNVYQNENADALLLCKLGILIINREVTEAQFQKLVELSKDESSLIMNVEREQVLSSTTLSSTTGVTLAAPPYDESKLTWGLQVTGADKSTFTGRGIKIAVLDTGLDFNHPDFKTRVVKSQSFVRSSSSPSASFVDVQDTAGHGTHCTGTVCGPQSLSIAPRYGVAPDVELYVGKIAVKAGNIFATNIYRAMEWAISEGCHIVSLSLAFPASGSGIPDATFEKIGQRALSAGTLIIAAAGNESKRGGGTIKPVGSPGNCPSIMAVAALDQNLKVADLSNGGSEIDIAAPGMNVYSCNLLGTGFPVNYMRRSGTSMATPHVAGIAALYAEKTGYRGKKLWDLLISSAKNVGQPAGDVGAGLVQAP
jgi:subtilisin family serine protease